ncbi:MAG: hypothetical protein CL725_08810 [Chloroflexi bacterium]|nr:hypothetical protein [Chloroflexota bacterium]|tara:strand:+ start:10441 stop:11259 length:819 start_codon:yes stop_codon:yes gene_type:complete
MNADHDDPLRAQHDALNPYRLAAGFVLRRFKWDLNPQSWRSRAVLRSWKNRYANDKAVILCNGPSLLKVDFELLQRSDVFCFGLNKINLLFDKTSFRPHCVVSVNPFVLEQNEKFYNETDLPLFLDSHAASFVRGRSNIAFLHSNVFPMFSRDVSVSVFQGYTVTFVAMQLAFHMGFRQVALVGADHTFATKGAANKTVVSGAKDESHFDPNYFAGGMKWQLPDLFQSEVAYTMARDMYAAHGGEIFNATVGGELEVFTRLHLDQFLGDRRG